MGVFKSLEKGLLDNIHKRIKMEQNFNSYTMTYHTTTFVDGIVVHEHSFDLTPLMQEMEKRILAELKPQLGLDTKKKK